MCACARASVNTCTHVCTCDCGGQRTASTVVPQKPSTVFIVAGFLAVLGFTEFARSGCPRPWGCSCLCFLFGGCKRTTQHSAVSHGFGELTPSRLHDKDITNSVWPPPSNLCFLSLIESLLSNVRAGGKPFISQSHRGMKSIAIHSTIILFPSSVLSQEALN